MRNYSLMSAHGPSRHLARRSDVSSFGGKPEVARSDSRDSTGAFCPLAATTLPARGWKRCNGHST